MKKRLALLTRMLAFVCGVCPICVMKRRYPASRFWARFRAAEKHCPACQAYYKLHGSSVP